MGSSNPLNPVCIVGIGCRLPGDVRSPSALWDFMVARKSAQGPVPLERFNIKGFYNPESDNSLGGTLSANGGYFLNEDVRKFDNDVFGINNLEATYMDPQQRKLLEVVFECFENAGVSMDDVSGTNTGVYVGNFTTDYQTMQMRDPDYLHRYSATGLGTAILSNRISHVFNLHGPSLTLDTACSSTMYCFHHAVRALETNDCAGAIVAGANLITSPEQHLGTAMVGVLSPTSSCNTFDESANGYGRAEAVNAVYLKRLSSARRSGDKIWAVVRSSAVNSNGRTLGITQPSSVLQAEVIRKAYTQASLDFADTDYIECHGTGTSVGDPIEVNGLAQCFSLSERSTPLMIGAIKTNFGHSEAASGLSSIIKVALALERGKVPPTHGPNKGMKVVTEVQGWPRHLRRAGINSFGYGGANAHLVLESFESYSNEPPLYRQAIQQPEMGFPDAQFIIPVSAASRISLEKRKLQVIDDVRSCSLDRLRSLTFTLSLRRTHLPLRDFLLVAPDGHGDSTYTEVTTTTEGVKLDSGATDPLAFAFVFTGQGAQYPGMGKELLQLNATFRATIKRLDGILQALSPDYAPSWTLEQSILDPEGDSKVNEAERSQPLCTAIQIAILSVLRGWGVEPSATIGHSSGEISAAYAAGLITETQAMAVAYFRGYVASRIQTSGAMLATSLSVELANKFIQDEKLEGLVCVACINSPQSVTLSGSYQSINLLFEKIRERKIFARKLLTGGLAYHSHMMKEVGSLYRDLLIPYFDSEVKKETSNIPMFSSVWPSQNDNKEMEWKVDMPKYWKENLELPVQFSSAAARLFSSGKYHLIEIGPHSTLKSPLRQTQLSLGSGLSPYSPTLLRNNDASLMMKQLAGTLFVHGLKLDWHNVNALPESGIEPLCDLPPYPWDYSADLLWHETRPSAELRARKNKRHELLGSQQVAGNSIDWSWRNVLHIDEVPWLVDHKVEAQVVFPAAAYLTMAMEAFGQICDIEHGKPKTCELFEFSNVNIRSALVVPDKLGLESEILELHTTMGPKKLSTATTSNFWYDFSVSSWKMGHAMVHCAGSIRLIQDTVWTPEPPLIEGMDKFELRPMAEWYDKMRKEGLCFGPQFQSLATLRNDGNRLRTDVVCGAKPNHTETNHRYSTRCARQVINLDACFQAAIISDSSGNISKQRAWLPMFIPLCRFRRTDLGPDLSELVIHARSVRLGVSTLNADSTLYDGNGTPLVELKAVRLSLYTGKVTTGPSSQVFHQQRHPFLRVSWKPDLHRLHPGVQEQVNSYIQKAMVNSQPNIIGDELFPIINAVIDLVAHKNPQMRVLEVGDGHTSKTRQCVDRIDKKEGFPRYGSWYMASLEREGNASLEYAIDKQGMISDGSQEATFNIAMAHLNSSGVVIMREGTTASTSFHAAGFSIIQLHRKLLLAIPPQVNSLQRGKIAVIVYLEPSDTVLSLVSCLSAYIRQNTGINKIHTVSLHELENIVLSSKTICISLIEVERDFLARMDQREMDLLRRITDSVTDLLWVTGSSASNHPKPNTSLANGLSRALMLEQPSMRFSVMTISLCNISKSNLMLTSKNILGAFTSKPDTDDKEFIEIDGLVHISRFSPRSEANRLFRRRMGIEEPTEDSILAEVEPVRLAIGQVGVTNTIHFKQLSEPLTCIQPGFVDVRVMAVSLNAKDVYALNGRVDTRNETTALEFSGVITAVGAGLETSHIHVGDRVVVLAPNRFTTTERVPAWAVHKILPSEEYSVMATLPVVYATALYALRNRAHLQPGESILIHGGSGAFGIAAITIAKRIGAVIYTTASSSLKRTFISDRFGIPQTNIFHSRDDSFVAGIMAATKDRGVDVVVNSLVGDLMHATWNCVASFGRFVEIGKRELVDAGKLDMSVFSRNATFTAFDLSELFFYEHKSYHEIIRHIVNEVLQMYRAGEIQPGPVTTFDISESDQAYRYFSSKDRLGKVVISLENRSSRISVAPPRYLATFDPSKVYLLIGCLGGLGRSLSRWMLARGARHFVFLGRSGCDKASARQLVSRLRDAGAAVTVVRGDVTNANEVNTAVAACKPKQIGGVVHAAMGLHEALFTSLTSHAWHTAIQPKLAGSWNLHHALEAGGHDGGLDFFLLTSSVSGTVGTATESNYCAANAFLDSFARWRRDQGKPAVSVGLGMISDVGYLHENPEIEALLLRRGIQPLNEDEFLQVIDLALTRERSKWYNPQQEDPDTAHILTGLEPFRVQELRAKGFDVSHGTMQDPRASIIAATFKATHNNGENSAVSGPGIEQLSDTHWLRSLPAHVSGALSTESDAPSLQEAVLRLTRRQFSNLILVAPDLIDTMKPLLGFGVDSMIAAEFRIWFWTAFRVDISFFDILSSSQSLKTLSELVSENLVQECVKERP
ncbi:putative polyketide synthase [Xylaria telfairii]|nr:putative polyketide synthase [Xylaria telfairii]